MAISLTTNQAHQRRNNIAGWLFCLPLILGTILFILFPLVFAIVISFTDYSMMDNASFFDFQFHFIGFANYVRAFKNEDFLNSLVNAAISALGVPLGIILSLFLTNLLIRYPKGSLFFRMVFYLPTVCGAVILTTIWQWLFTLIPNVLSLHFGWQWFSLLSNNQFRISMIVMGVWSGVGTSCLLLYASLKGVDKALYEAAEVDGANALQQMTHITIPAISPTLFYLLVTGIAGSFQDFARFQVMGKNVPAWYSVVPVWEIYKQCVNGGNIAYASALGLILGWIIILLSAIQFFLSKYLVNFE